MKDMKAAIAIILVIGIVFFSLVTPSALAATSLASVNPLSVGTFQELIGLIIQAIFGVTGTAALLMFVWGGFLWLTAAGVEERIRGGINTMVWAVIGLAVIFGAYAILNFIIGGITR